MIDIFLGKSSSTDDRALDLALLAGLADLGWNKALDAAQHPDPAMRDHAWSDLQWWVDRGTRGLNRL